jgi:hypothetical protein
MTILVYPDDVPQYKTTKCGLSYNYQLLNKEMCKVKPYFHSWQFCFSSVEQQNIHADTTCTAFDL